MTDRPILFSSAMVRALLAGRKTQTRRVLMSGAAEDIGIVMAENPPRFAIGDRLWVRETFRGAAGYDDLSPANFGNKPIWYKADGEPGERWWFLSKRARPGIHMPRIYSRLTLTVTDVCVQRLQEISRDDAIAEGLIKLPASGRYVVNKGDQYFGLADHNPRLVYQWLWDDLNEKRGYGWETNPWVVAVSFSVRHGNIDQTDVTDDAALGNPEFQLTAGLT